MHAAPVDPANELAAFAEAAIGGRLSPEVHALIAQAGQLREQPRRALALLRQAQAAAPQHPAPLIGLYRFHFYAHEWEQARAVAEDALAIARTALGPDFGDLPPPHEATRHDAAVRFYLFTLKGLAYLHVRLGNLEEARSLLTELRRLDPADHVGGAVMWHVITRHGGSDGGHAVPDYPSRGWERGAP